MLALVPWPGINPRPPALGTRSQPLDQQVVPAGPILTSVLMLVFTQAGAQVTGGLQKLPVSSHLSLPLLPGCLVLLPLRAPSPSAPSFLGWSGQHCPSSCCCYCCCSWPACCPPPKRTTAALRLTTLPGPSTPCCGTPTGHPRHRGSAWPTAPHHQSVDLVSNLWVTLSTGPRATSCGYLPLGLTWASSLRTLGSLANSVDWIRDLWKQQFPKEPSTLWILICQTTLLKRSEIWSVNSSIHHIVYMLQKQADSTLEMVQKLTHPWLIDWNNHI